MDLKSKLKGLKDAKASKRGVYLDEGTYLLKVKNTLWVTPFDGPEAFVAEFEVVESTNKEKHPIGSERSWYRGMRFKDSALGEVKSFTYATLSLDESVPEDREKMAKVDEHIEELVERAINQNTFAGKLIRCDVSKGKSTKKKDDKGEPVDVTRYRFSAVKNAKAA